MSINVMFLPKKKKKADFYFSNWIAIRLSFGEPFSPQLYSSAFF